MHEEAPQRNLYRNESDSTNITSSSKLLPKHLFGEHFSCLDMGILGIFVVNIAPLSIGVFPQVRSYVDSCVRHPCLLNVTFTILPSLIRTEQSRVC